MEIGLQFFLHRDSLLDSPSFEMITVLKYNAANSP